MFLGHSLKELDISIDLIIQLTNPHQIKGQSSLSIKRIASLREAQAGDLSFLGNKKYQNQVGDSQASVILLPLDVDFQPRPNQVLLFVPHPSEALSSVCQAIEKNFLISPVQPGIHPSSCIDPTAHIDPTATIGPYCFVGPHSHIGPHSVLVSHIHIGSHVEIGSSAYLMPQVTVLDYCVLGDRVRLHSGVVIGSDGFGYTTINGLHQKQPQIGIVVVEDDVEIGAHTTIDRARFSETCIGCGTKIDNLVQIAHNVQIGAHSIIVAQVGIAGSTQLGQQVVVGGQAGIAGHLTIGDQCMIGAQTGLNHDLDPKSYVRGTPAYPIAHAMRLDVLHKKLPDLYKKVSTLEEKMKSMQEPSSPHEQAVYGSNQ